VIAVTGSCGKTTVKEMIAHLLPRKVHKTPGNWNNDIGLPLSLLSLRPEHDYAVFEVGMNQPGEIALLASILKPDIAVITNIYPAHLQGLGSLQAIAAEKAALLDALPSPKGIAVINADDSFFLSSGNVHKRKQPLAQVLPNMPISVVLLKTKCFGLELLMENGYYRKRSLAIMKP